MSKLRLPKKHLVVNYEDLQEISFPMDEKFNLIVFKDGVKCDFVVNLKRNTDKLLVLGSGLTPRDKVPKLNPYYNRVSWNFKYSTIFFNDPSSYIDDDIYGAWGIGTKDHWYIEIIADVIKKLADNLYDYTEDNLYNNIIFIGSSQGGFISFMLSVLVKNSSSICDIPQTDLFSGFELDKWKPFHIYKKSILNIIFENDDISTIYNEFGYRLNFIELMKRENYIPNAFLCLDCSFDMDFEDHYLPFLKELDKLPFKDEFSNTIRIRVDGKNVEHRNMSKKSLMDTIDNVIFINHGSFEKKIPWKENIQYNIVENNVKNNGIIRFYGLNNLDINNLNVVFNDKIIPFYNLEKGLSESLGEYYDFPAFLLGVGVHNICLKYGEEYSKISKVFVKDKFNVLDYNIWTGSDYCANLNGIISGNGQLIETSNEWCVLGNRCLKITRVGDNFRWTDIPIEIPFVEGNIIKTFVDIKSNCDTSIFIVFTDLYDNQSFSMASIVKKDSVRNIYIEEKVPNNIKKVSLRFWLKGEVGEEIFVDNIKVIVDKFNIAIYGSCCSKDPFTTLFNQDYKRNYVSVINDQRHSFISTMQNKEYVDYSLLELPKSFNGNSFTTKCFIEDFNKNFIDSMLDNSIDYLVFDVYFEVINGVLYFNKNKLISNAVGINKTKWFELLKCKSELNIVENTDEFYDLWVNYCDKFFDFLKINSPNTKVVLVEVRLLDKVLRDDGSIYVDDSFKEKANVYNPFIIKLENYVKENFDVSVIPFNENCLCYENHIWGKHPIHYFNSYYKDFLEKFNKIVKFNNSKI